MQTNFISDDTTLKLTPLMDASYEVSSDETLDHSNINTTNPQCISSPITDTQWMHSMSDDEVHYLPSHADHDDNDKKEDFMPPLKLKDTLSASAALPLKRKGKKGRSNSAIIASKNTDKYHDKWKTLKKQYKMQTDKLQVVQGKFTDLQDEREELESNLKKEFELKMLHLETKWHLEKNEKDSLRHENEKLRQQLFVRNQELQRMQSIASGYSTGSINGGGSVVNGQTPLIQRISTHSIQSIPSDNKSPQSSPTGSSSSTNTTTNSESANDSSSDDDNSSSSGAGSTITSSISHDDDHHQKTNTAKKDEGDHYTKNVINTDPKRTKKRTSKNKKMSKQLNKKIRQQQPKGFWSTVWSLFGPPELMCSCSDNSK